MPNPKPPSPPEFREEAVRICRESGRSLQSAPISGSPRDAPRSREPVPDRCRSAAGAHDRGPSWAHRVSAGRTQPPDGVGPAEKPPPSSPGRARPGEHLPVHRCGEAIFPVRMACHHLGMSPRRSMTGAPDRRRAGRSMMVGVEPATHGSGNRCPIQGVQKSDFGLNKDTIARWTARGCAYA
jgi:hypothetical protein